MKKTKCDLCDKSPVICYWYGDREHPSSLAVCSDHEHRVDWAGPFSFRIERRGEKAVEFEQNAYSKKIIDEGLVKNHLMRHDPRTSNDPVKECLIDAIVEALPLQVSRKLFDKWSLEELKRFSPLNIGQEAPRPEPPRQKAPRQEKQKIKGDIFDDPQYRRY